MQYLTTLTNIDATLKFARQIAESIVPNLVIALRGDLGSGKTTLIRGVLQQLGVSGTIKSPTYTIVEPYAIHDLHIYHFDLYRFNAAHEWLDGGFDEYLTSGGICFIEWAEKAQGLISPLDWQLKISLNNSYSHEIDDDVGHAIMDNHNMDQARLIEINSMSIKGKECLQKLMKYAAV
ncbi:MAG: tRNA (adenosine(37)-N6)-threonylcarbamoyltransferase complex ATPase subunit type 1 TsaE [Burkholderiales bacterium]|nr:tRNA (adenosine(37)-N6)-threonylcarbamoyltransferase complex ATPase subunit type 1 TsaE [Burkholderiales bacterium]